jgi:glucose-1-phosphate thymidylyltransferase
MQGAVPAAGEGTRLRPLTADKPEGMVEVAGQPLLTHVFETLLDAGVEELVVVVGYEMDSIISHYGDEFRGVPVTYAHQREQLGLAHAVLQAEPHVNGQFVVLNGDNVFQDGIRAAFEQAAEPGIDAALLVEEVTPEAARETGVVEVDEGQVTGLIEKPDEPPSRLATTGCYILPKEVFAAARLLRPSTHGECELTDAVGVLVRAGTTVEAVRYDGQRCNVNTPADVERAERFLK